jgi:hypothetical protein
MVMLPFKAISPIFLTVGLTLILLTTAASAQNFARPSDQWFRVSWGPRTYGVAPAIEGQVHNDSDFWVSNVRLRVEGLDAEKRPVGELYAWTFGNIAPGGWAYFVVQTMPGAATYRITVSSFDVVSHGGG